jgi:hypothetical protein
MFYIIASRIPLVYSDTTNRKFLKIFILGSLLYICIHYYLHLEVRSGIIDKIKSKLLFVMAGDFAIACALAKFLSPIVTTPADGDSEDNDKPKYLANEKERIMKELEERRKAELLRNQQALAQQALAQQALAQQQLLAQQQAQQAQQATQKTTQVRVQEAAAQEKADKTKVKPKSRKKDTTSSSSTSTSTSTSEESVKPKKSDKKSDKKAKKDKHSDDEESTEMPVYE